MRGYYGIGIVAGKTPENVGGLWRSAHALGASFIFTVGHRYPDRVQPTDTTNAARHIPLYTYDSISALVLAIPRDCQLVGIECPGDQGLARFAHPERAVYLLGAEDRGLPNDAADACAGLVEIPSSYCLNVATAGSIVMYDRIAKANRDK